MRSSRYRHKRTSQKTRYNKSPGDIFDPQRMLQHPYTRTQKDGLTLRPKLHNLNPEIPRIDQELLQKYYSICLSYNMFNPNVIPYNVLIDLSTSTTYYQVSLNSQFINNLLTSVNVNIPKIAYLTSIAINKSTSTPWPPITLTLCIGTSQYVESTGSYESDSGSNDDLIFGPPQSYSPESSFGIEVPYMSISSTSSNRAFLGSNKVSPQQPLSDAWNHVKDYIENSQSLYWAAINSPIGNDLWSKISVNCTDLPNDSIRYLFYNLILIY